MASLLTTPFLLDINPFKLSSSIKTQIHHRRKKTTNTRKISCKNTEEEEPSHLGPGMFDRRNMLLGLGGFCGGVAAGLDPLAFSAPIGSPDLQDLSNKNALIVREKVRDCLDNKILSYTYQDVPIPWLKSRPTPRTTIKGKTKAINKKSGIANAAESPKRKTNADEFPLVLNRTIRTIVPRPETSRSKKAKEDIEEILVVEGIEVDKDVFVKFDVFINDEDDPVSRPDDTEFAGSFVNVPHRHTHKKQTKTRLKLGLTDLLEDLDVEGDDTIVVTLVPRAGAGNVTIGGIKIDLED